jgi:hypothetical protein
MAGPQATSADFPWLREMHGAQCLRRRPDVDAATALAAMNEGGGTAAGLGRGGGGRIDHPALGPVRVKVYRRGGLFGKFFPQCGLDESAARRELEGEAALRAAGLLTQETLAMAAQPDAPRLRSLQRFFPEEPAYAELKFAGKLNPAQQAAAEELLNAIWRAGFLHHDANGGNLLWNDAARRWRIIDLASLRPLTHPWPGGPVAMMRRRLEKPPRQFRHPSSGAPS